jgi:hypothetical protein
MELPHVLTEEQRANYRRWLDEGVGRSNLTCIMCASDDLHISGFFRLPVYTDPSQGPTDLSIATVALVCGRCGYVMEFTPTRSNPLP